MTNSITPGGTVAVTQLAGGNEPYEIDVSALAVMAWQPNVYVAPNAILRPTQANQTGFWYQNGGKAGQSGLLEPGWPKTAGATLIDGSCTLTALVPPVTGADVIASVTWTQKNPPDGTLTITDQSFTGLTGIAFIGGGTRGNVYQVVVAVTMQSTAIWPANLYITIL